jgi:hypothetical protein
MLTGGLTAMAGFGAAIMGLGATIAGFFTATFIVGFDLALTLAFAFFGFALTAFLATLRATDRLAAAFAGFAFFFATRFLARARFTLTTGRFFAFDFFALRFFAMIPRLLACEPVPTLESSPEKPRCHHAYDSTP